MAEQVKVSKVIHYRGYLIQPASLSFSTQTDWSFAHEDFDGTGSDDEPWGASVDQRYGHGASPEDCIRQIDERYDMEGDDDAK